MIRFRLGEIPVVVQPWIFITAYLIGPRNTGPLAIALWIVSVLVGILLHELGHALVGRRYGLRRRAIELRRFQLPHTCGRAG